jgi:hypothetical protein
VGDSILNNESVDAFGMGEDHAEADGPAVVLHIKMVARQTESFGEVGHDFGDMVEGIGEFFRVGPSAVAEAGIVGRDQMIAIRKAGEERFEHA